MRPSTMTTWRDTHLSLLQDVSQGGGGPPPLLHVVGQLGDPGLQDLLLLRLHVPPEQRQLQAQGGEMVLLEGT